MSSPKNRFWRVKLALLVLSTLLGVVALETAVRVAGLDNPILWEPDPRLGWHHVPRTRAHWTEEGDGHVRINTLGFRDAERSVRKESGVFRIAVFGDSTTEALQVDLEQTFCQLLEKRLNQRGIRAEVLNFGVSGYGSLQEYLLYSERGREFNPDLVLQAIFLDNDVADGDRRLATSQRGAPFLEDTPEPEFSVDYSAAVASAANYAREPVHTVRKLSATVPHGERAAEQARVDVGACRHPRGWRSGASALPVVSAAAPSRMAARLAAVRTGGRTICRYRQT